MTRWIKGSVIAAAVGLGATTAMAAPAHADTAVATHALVVGSNAAGPGQTTLRYAEDDARRVGKLLTELGGYAPGSVDVVTHPTPAVLRTRLAALGQRVAADAAAGKQSRVFFYYSGHARATGIDLGAEEMPLAELREKLFATRAQLTVVVLDACQSGAFSRIKGAQPAADFSFNSRQQLGAEGVAVLASSTGSELSQESEQLRSSYFTHHLLVGMRGAGDANGDGEVTVDEAYRYAYHQTLLSTAETAVGGQHVTLEVDLKGHGEVALSYPRAASAAIVLPAALEGKALVSSKRSKTVVAETQKAKGAAVRIAVAPGPYEVLVRQGDHLLRCPVAAPGAVDPARCSRERYVDSTRKGAGVVPPWQFALTGQIGAERNDDFVQTLRDFGYRDEIGPGVELRAALDREWYRSGNLALAFGGQLLWRSAPRWTRDTELAPLRFSWSTTAACASVRAKLYLTDRNYLHLANCLGVAVGRSRLLDQNDLATRNTDVGVFEGARLGISHERLFGTPIEIGIGGGYSFAPVVKNDIGDTHDSGGVFVGIGLGYSIGGSR